jgi:hypothetical protein
LYISEVAPARIRGRLTTVQQVMIISGLTAAFVVNYFLQQAADGGDGDDRRDQRHIHAGTRSAHDVLSPRAPSSRPIWSGAQC